MLSINDLLKGVASASKRIEPKEGQLYSPDIPQTTLDDEIAIRDQFENQMKVTTLPRNGTGYALSAYGSDISLMDPRKADFITDGSIDPNVIMSKIDPDKAQPSYNKYSKFSLMPDSVKPPKNQVELLRRSHASELNFRNRYNAQSGSNDQQPQANTLGSAMKQPLTHTGTRTGM